MRATFLVGTSSKSDVLGFGKHYLKFSTTLNKNYTSKIIFVKFVAFRVLQTFF